jgi:hypothetical protein
MSFARIAGTGSFLPSNVVSNADRVFLLASRGIETSDDWIYSRSGIQSRRFADRQSQTSDLAAAAASRALSAAELEADDVDLIYNARWSLSGHRLSRPAETRHTEWLSGIRHSGGVRRIHLCTHGCRCADTGHISQDGTRHRSGNVFEAL